MEHIVLTSLTREKLVKEITSEVLSGMEKLLSSTRKKGGVPKEYLTRKEVASLLKVSLVTISDWSKTGILKPYKIGSRVRFRKEEVYEALKELETSRA